MVIELSGVQFVELIISFRVQFGINQHGRVQLGVWRICDSEYLSLNVHLKLQYLLQVSQKLVGLVFFGAITFRKKKQINIYFSGSHTVRMLIRYVYIQNIQNHVCYMYMSAINLLISTFKEKSPTSHHHAKSVKRCYPLYKIHKKVLTWTVFS